MHCRSATTIEFKSRLGFNQYDITMKKEALALKSIRDTFEGENTQIQYFVLRYKINLYFHDYKLAIEIDKKGRKDKNIDHEFKRQKALEKELSFEFIRISPDEENFDISKANNEIFRHIKESTKD